jgi:hypothetical protein
LYRGVIDCKKGYQPRNNIVEEEKGDLATDSHSILARLRNYFSQLLNVRGVNDVTQTEIHTAEPVVPEPAASDFELGVEKLKSKKLQGVDEIPAELIKARGRTIFCEIYKLIISIWNKVELPEEWKSRSLYLSIGRAMKQILVIIGAYQFCQICTKYYSKFCSRG